MREYDPLIKENHSIHERFEAIVKIFNNYGLSDVLQDDTKVSFRFNEEEGIFMYFLYLNDVRFKLPQNFRMELNELAYAEIVDIHNSTTRVDKYRFQGMHINPEVRKSKDYIAFDFEPDKVRYPKVHINADKKTWGDHLTFPDTTNLNINRMSCPLALKVFNKYAQNKNDFPTDQQKNGHYVQVFEEVNEYGL